MNSRLEPPHREPVMCRADVDSWVAERGDWQPQFDLLWIREPWRHDADDARSYAENMDGAADNAGPAAEGALPQAVADHGHRRNALRLLCGGERPADPGSGA